MGSVICPPPEDENPRQFGIFTGNEAVLSSRRMPGP